MAGLIARVHSRRSLATVLISGSVVSCKIVLSSEFGEVLPGLASSYHFKVSFFEKSTGKFDVVSSTKVDISEEVTISFRVPSICHTCDVKIEASWLSSDKSDTAIVLPLTYENVTVMGKESWEKRRLSTVPCLGCTRELCYFSRTIRVREEYGLSIGTHIYDSSIVLLEYLSRELTHSSSNIFGDNMQSRRGTAVELGAGCGAVGMSLSAVFEKVYVTDRGVELALAEQNIQRNQLHNCYARSLDWSDPAELERFQKEIDSQNIDLILAGDVFYDPSAAALFFNVLSKLSQNFPGALIILAQRCREPGGGARMELAHSVIGYEITRLFEGSRVILWRLQWSPIR